MQRKLLLTVAFVALFSGCSNLDIMAQKTVKKTTISQKSENKNQLDVLSFPSELRASYVFIDNEGKKRFCAEPFSDTAASSTLTATASAVNNLTNTLNTSAKRSAVLSHNKARSRSVNGGGLGEEKTSSGEDSGNMNRSSEGNYGMSTAAEQSLNLGLSTANQIVALEGRTQFVLLAREMLYRTCEAAANEFIPEEFVPKQHERIFDALKAMIVAQRKEAEARNTEAKAEVVRAAAAGSIKLDSSVLKEINGIESIMLESYLEEYKNCLKEMGADSTRAQPCEKDYNRKLKMLME